jgi:arylsulfatase A-like enzyme
MKEDSGKPNVLVLFTDQQRFDTIKAAGFDHMITPNLDRLVGEGCLFENAYTPNPVCIPARHNLITGLTARTHGYPNNAHKPMDSAIPTLPRILSDNGYITRAIGKMHFQPPRRHHGFDKMELMEELPYKREDDEYAMYLKEVGLGHIQHIHGVRHLLYMLPQRSLIPEKHHGSTWVGDRSVEFLRANYDRPFFLWSSWIAPHPPFDVPDNFSDLYSDVELPRPIEGAADLPDFYKTKSRNSGDIPNTEVLMRMRELYYASITLVDKNVGKILNSLGELGILDDTLVIFTSDHGEMLGDYGLYQKALPFDRASRIPFVARYPEKIKPGTVRSEFVDLNDILPTILDVTSIDYPGDYDLPGESIFAEDPVRDREVQYVENGREGRRWVFMRDKRYKYVYFYCGKEALYDLESDPEELNNLLGGEIEKDIFAVKESLKKKLIRYEEKHGLKGNVKDGDFVSYPAPEPQFGRNPQFPRFPLAINDSQERADMNSVEEEILAAVKSEPLVRLGELDLDEWLKNGGSQNLARKVREEGL